MPAPHARAFDALEIEAEIGCVPLDDTTQQPRVRQPKPAIERACEWAEAVGRATRAAHDICHDCPMDWPRRDVLTQWHLFAWATRARRDLIPRYRKELQRAIARYRRTTMSDDPKTYLGDGVYCSFDGFHFWVWTSNGIRDSEKIALEPGVIASLLAFRKRIYEEHGAPLP